MRQPKRRKKWIILGSLALPIAGVGGFFLAKPQAQSPLIGQSAKAPSDKTAEKRFTGVVAARYETQIGFRVAGKIAERKIEIGQAIKRGDVLMTLDPADYQSSLRAAEANRASAMAQKVQTEAEQTRQIRLLKQGWTTRSTYDRTIAAGESGIATGRNLAQCAWLCPLNCARRWHHNSCSGGSWASCRPRTSCADTCS
jgi:multidrug efflux pump subunit AcrA (membrane-fusion protein)